MKIGLDVTKTIVPKFYPAKNAPAATHSHLSEYLDDSDNSWLFSSFMEGSNKIDIPPLLHESGSSCKHTCKDKINCKHDCCKLGLKASRREKRSLNIDPNDNKTLPKTVINPQGDDSSTNTPKRLKKCSQMTLTSYFASGNDEQIVPGSPPGNPLQQLADSRVSISSQKNAPTFSFHQPTFDVYIARPFRHNITNKENVKVSAISSPHKPRVTNTTPVSVNDFFGVPVDCGRTSVAMCQIENEKDLSIRNKECNSEYSTFWSNFGNM